MILLCGIPSEPPLRLVAEAAESADVPYRLLSQRHLADTELDCRRGRAVLRHRDWEMPTYEVRGVYSRWMSALDLPEAQDADGDRAQRIQRVQSRVLAWIESAGCRVMNRGRPMASNASKPFQIQHIAAAGFTVPETLVTNLPDEVRAFVREHRKVVYKSISSERSQVQMLYGPRLLDLERVRLLPTQFQAFVPGSNLRVHVAGDEVLAVEIRSAAVDYRYPEDHEPVEIVPHELPDDVVARCLDLSRRLRLPLCGIDLKRTPDGDHVCFEANPSPAYSYYQQASGLDIASAIVRWLAG